MEENINNKVNPWCQIPLADYEAHMADVFVGQLQLLNLLTKKYLDQIKPESSIFLGVAGGNGLEHIDENFTRHVIGIDINEDYLEETRKRYGGIINNLQLINYDITQRREAICQADLIWAALIMEYTGIDKCLQFAKENLLHGGHFVLTIQVNNHLAKVSQTGIESVKKAGEVFKAIDTEELMDKALQAGFSMYHQEENYLPNGKSFKTFHLVNS